MLRKIVLLVASISIAIGAGLWWLGFSSSEQVSRIDGKPLPDVASGPTLLTWNLQWFPGNKQKATEASEESQIASVARELLKADAEIVCLQELKGSKGSDAIERLLAVLPEYRLQMMSEFRGTQEIAIISKIDAHTAFAEQFEKAEATPPRGFVHASFDFDGHRLLVYSVHLKSNYGGVQANIPKREEAARQLLKHVALATASHLEEGAKSVSVILAGDFNTSLRADQFSDETTARLFLEAGYDWGFRGIPESKTITWLSDGRYPDAVFDHFFCLSGESVICGRSTTLPTDRKVSDHRPVVMRIGFPKE